MKIVFLLDEQYPNGMAAANRAHLYAKGFVELGHNVVMFIPRATELPGKVRNPDARGTHEGVSFRYARDTVIKKTFLGRRYQNAMSLTAIINFLMRFRPDVILVAAKDFKYILLVKICSILTGAKLVREKSEIPFYRMENISGYMKSRIKAEFRLFDGMIVISGALADFFHKDMELNIRTIEVPILVDCSKIEFKNKAEHVQSNLVYTGSLQEHKDGVLTIIRAFSRIRTKHPGLRLILTGNIDRSVDKEKILSEIDSLRLKDDVEITGYISKEKLSELTSTAYALLLAKPLNRQNRYNMATKVGEYLLTGRPAVISSVDPVSRYLEHRKNACIIDPDDRQMADEIEFLLLNPAEAESIGLSGRDSALKLFDYRIHAPALISFFESLKNRNGV